jgi:tryptophan 2,3-dioxygenase
LSRISLTALPGLAFINRSKFAYLETSNNPLQIMADGKVYYSESLELEKILNSQLPKSAEQNYEAHDEMLFIIIHQTYELWFKQILHEVGSVKKIISKPEIRDNSPDLSVVVHRLKRVREIFTVLVDQINILETMTPLDFLDFRNLLRPASGFQSIQFKSLEASLGLKMDHRHGGEYYRSQLKAKDIESLKAMEHEKSLVELLNDWLERIPFFSEGVYWKNYDSDSTPEGGLHIFWQDYRQLYDNSLLEVEKENLKAFDQVFYGEEGGERRLSPTACRAALFIMLYRGYPLLQLPFQLLNSLLDLDELMATWRYRHMNMVHRMIGTRVGTGGSSGRDYLKAALDKHYIFSEIASLTSFLIERRNLPKLSTDLEIKLGFNERETENRKIEK